MSEKQATKPKTAVKICGFKNVDGLESVFQAPIDYIGFVFAPSKRQITARQAKSMTERIRSLQGSSPRTVGVFVNPEELELTAAVLEADLDAVQLHGQETPDFCRKMKQLLKVDLIKAIPVRSGQTEEEVAAYLNPYAGTIDAILLDTYDPHVGGGTGRTFAWEQIPYYRKWSQQHGINLFVAGGLEADNVGELISKYEPFGVDVSSGVETDGNKDAEKILQFVGRVKQS